MSEPRASRPLVGIALILATIVGFAAVLAIWAKRQVLETDSWVETSSQLLEDEEIQAALSTFITDALFASVDVQAELEQRLPPQAQVLAGPAAGGLRELAGRIALQALQGPRTQAVWEDANRLAHETLIRVVEDDGELVSTGEGTVQLDVAAIVEQVGERTGLDVAGKVPAEVASFEVLRSDQLAGAQDATRILRDMALILPFLAIGLYGLAIYLAKGARREALRAAGWGFIAAGALALLVQRLGGNYVVDTLATTAAAEPAAESTWEIGTSMLRDGALAVIGYGVVIVIGAWLAGPGALAREARREITPILSERRVGYSVLAALTLIIFWWNPTEGTSRILPSLVLVALLVAGFEALRAQAIRDYPDETMETAGERWRGRLAGLRPGTAAAPATDDSERRLAQLERLARLREAGVLDDAELTAEKQRLLTT